MDFKDILTKDYPKKDNAKANLELAQQFIKYHLTEQPKDIATIVINYDVKEHFDIKKEDIGALKAALKRFKEEKSHRDRAEQEQRVKEEHDKQVEEKELARKPVYAIEKSIDKITINVTYDFHCPDRNNSWVVSLKKEDEVVDTS